MLNKAARTDRSSRHIERWFADDRMLNTNIHPPFSEMMPLGQVFKQVFGLQKVVLREGAPCLLTYIRHNCPSRFRMEHSDNENFT